MDSAQELLQQPIVLAALAGIFILSAVILFIVPLLLGGFDKLKSAFSTAPKKPVKKPTPEPKPEVKQESKAAAIPQVKFGINRNIVLAAVTVVVAAVVVVGGLWVYQNYVAEKGTPKLESKPNYNLQYSISGPVKKIDKEKNVITVLDKMSGKDYVLKKNALTEVYRDKQEIDFGEIMMYDIVVVRSNADFQTEEVNIFEIDILSPGTSL